jgi:hypothetical protein
MKGDVLHHLHKNSAQAEHEHGPELRIPGHADNDLQAGIGHFLHIDALDEGARRQLAEIRSIIRS